MLRTYRLRARNTVPDSENKIHDDTVARRFGFAGGLVPGVVVHAYCTHPAVEEWGLEWIAAGSIRARFDRPVYDGDDIVVEPTGERGKEAGVEEERIELVVRRGVEDDTAEGVAGAGAGAGGGNTGTTGAGAAGETAATALVGPPDASGAADTLATLGTDRRPHTPLPPPEERPAASPESLAAGTVLGSFDVALRPDIADIYLEAVGETLPVYREAGVAHPGWLIALANFALAANVRLGPWIHVESDVRHLGLVHVGEETSTRALVRRTFEAKGHKFVDLDVLVVAAGERPVLSARHVAIYEPRAREPGPGR